MKKYNIIYIHTHDTGKVIEPYGYNVNSKNLSQFFEEALSFQNAHSVAPTCSPSRASLLTGQYPHQVGMLGLAQRGFKLDNSKHLANFLKNKGYYTILSGVQHESHYYTDHSIAYKELGYIKDITSDEKRYSEEELIYWDDDNSKLLIDWLSEYEGDKPLFISFGLHGTHRKYPQEIDLEFNVNTSVPPFYIFNNNYNREDFAEYKTSLKFTDKSIGRVLKKLEDLGYYDNSIIIITTDHGLAYPNGKCTLKDTGTGVLLAMHVPNSKNSGKTYDGLISQIDIFPTICDLIGVEKPDYLEGKSFSSIFTTERLEDYRSVREEVFSQINFHTSYEPTRSIRTSRYKYIRYFDDEYLKYNLSNIDKSYHKDFLLEHNLQEKQKCEEYLYDLYFDPAEGNNLINDSEYSDVLNNMRNLLYEYMNDTDDPLLKGKIKVKEEWKVNKPECIDSSSKDPKDYINPRGED